MKYWKADLKWITLRLSEKLARYLWLPFKTIPSRTPDLYSKIIINKNVPIEMRDGVRLYADIYRPVIDEPFPVILIRLPYGKDAAGSAMVPEGKFWAKKGYICVIQDVRGKYRSQGEWVPFIHEIEDGYDTVDQIAKQPWCNGNIGMTGKSYCGYTCWAAAVSGHPKLKCIAPGVTATDVYNTWIYNNGAFCLGSVGKWGIAQNSDRAANKYRLNTDHLPLMETDDAAAMPCSYFKEWLNHPTRDSYWDKINLNRFYSKIKIPVLNISGWYDLFLKGALNDWQGVATQSHDPHARLNQWLMLGPYDHSMTTETTGRIGRLNIGTKHRGEWYDTLQHFFDYWLQEMENGFDQTERIKIFTINDNDWRYESQWPVSNVRMTRYYLHSQGGANRIHSVGVLNPHEPGEEPCDVYFYDPQNPVDITHATDLWRQAKTMSDRQTLEKRSDVLLYKSLPLKNDMEITGPLMMTLYASSSASDTDFTAAFVDIFPNGYVLMIQEGIIRAAFRVTDRKQTLIKPERLYKYEIDMIATSYVIQKGHRLGVEISSSNFDRFDRNLNTAGGFGASADMVRATQKIYHSHVYPSHITLPIVPR
jgi:putative CocE/NonD family hydrolase